MKTISYKFVAIFLKPEGCDFYNVTHCGPSATHHSLQLSEWTGQIIGNLPLPLFSV